MRRAWLDLLLLAFGALLCAGGVLMGYLVTIARGMPHGPAQRQDLVDFALVAGPLALGLALVTWAAVRMRTRGRRPG